MNGFCNILLQLFVWVNFLFKHGPQKFSLIRNPHSKHKLILDTPKAHTSEFCVPALFILASKGNVLSMVVTPADN